jgi:hypothetical protein
VDLGWPGLSPRPSRPVSTPAQNLEGSQQETTNFESRKSPRLLSDYHPAVAKNKPLLVLIHSEGLGTFSKLRVRQFLRQPFVELLVRITVHFAPF